ncbi:TasA family protein [Salinibacterium hongtaonis]|uniref:TasA family protein n=1 Tax=Homoserinimonas hongtaonis TaxID=2079791 RepID=UPI000D37A1DB|nr:TasA family protein [Salinibacterium hongtaonis]AWB89587.1 hypothetical protein C2138_08565 [Salinibacterium hongtaonis]
MPMQAPQPRRSTPAGRAPVRSMLTITAAAAGATLVAVCAAGGTYGLWADSAAVSAGVVTSGSLNLTINNLAEAPINATAWGSMFPGDRVQQTVTVKNTGTVAADVTVAATSSAAAASDYAVEVAKGACPSGAADISSTNALQAPPIALGNWTATASSVVCIEVTLSPTASNVSNGATVPFTLTMTATQKTVYP